MKTPSKTISGTLKYGLRIKDVVHKDFSLRETTTRDLFEAEMETEAGKPLTFNGALMARQLLNIGSYKGPFTLDLIATLRTADYAILRKAQLDLDTQGEADEAGEGKDGAG